MDESIKILSGYYNTNDEEREQREKLLINFALSLTDEELSKFFHPEYVLNISFSEDNTIQGYFIEDHERFNRKKKEFPLIYNAAWHIDLIKKLSYSKLIYFAVKECLDWLEKFYNDYDEELNWSNFLYDNILVFVTSNSNEPKEVLRIGNVKGKKIIKGWIKYADFNYVKKKNNKKLFPNKKKFDLISPSMEDYVAHCFETIENENDIFADIIDQGLKSFEIVNNCIIQAKRYLRRPKSVNKKLPDYVEERIVDKNEAIIQSKYFSPGIEGLVKDISELRSPISRRTFERNALRYLEEQSKKIVYYDSIEDVYWVREKDFNILASNRGIGRPKE